MDLQLNGKNALITGGSKGIGKAIAKVFVDEGANVFITARNLEFLEQAKADLGGKVTYNNAKSALISFTKSLADEVISYGIRVNSISPGSILHETGNWLRRMNEVLEGIREFIKKEIPAVRFGATEENANVAAFLASEKASWIFGASINVDGGQSKMNF